MRTLLAPCEACQGEGRIITQGQHVWDEIDHGTCPECHGACVIEVETSQRTLADYDDEATEEYSDNGPTDPWQTSGPKS